MRRAGSQRLRHSGKRMTWTMGRRIGATHRATPGKRPRQMTSVHQTRLPRRCLALRRVPLSPPRRTRRRRRPRRSLALRIRRRCTPPPAPAASGRTGCSRLHAPGSGVPTVVRPRRSQRTLRTGCASGWGSSAARRERGGIILGRGAAREHWLRGGGAGDAPPPKPNSPAPPNFPNSLDCLKECTCGESLRKEPRNGKQHAGVLMEPVVYEHLWGAVLGKWPGVR